MSLAEASSCVHFSTEFQRQIELKHTTIPLLRALNTEQDVTTHFHIPDFLPSPTPSTPEFDAGFTFLSKAPVVHLDLFVKKVTCGNSFQSDCGNLWFCLRPLWGIGEWRRLAKLGGCSVAHPGAGLTVAKMQEPNTNTSISHSGHTSLTIPEMRRPANFTRPWFFRKDYSP